MKKLLLILLVVLIGYVLVFFGSVGLNKLATLKYNKTFHTIEEGVSSAHYVIKQVPIGERALKYYHGSMIAYNVKTSFVDSVDSYLLFDTLEKMVKIHQPMKRGDVDTMQVTSIGADGQIKSSETVTKWDAPKLFKNCILLKNSIANFQPWTDSKQPLYLVHFAKEEFLSGSYFDMRIFPTPTGNSSGDIVWSGTGYYQLTFNNEQLKFKMQCASPLLISAPNYDYVTGIDYYPLPEKYNMHLAIILYESHNLYVVKRKQ